MNTDDLENFEAERELQLAQEYQDVVSMFRFAVESERRFYLANEVVTRVASDGPRPLIEWSLEGPPQELDGCVEPNPISCRLARPGRNSYNAGHPDAPHAGALIIAVLVETLHEPDPA